MARSLESISAPSVGSNASRRAGDAQRDAREVPQLEGGAGALDAAEAAAESRVQSAVVVAEPGRRPLAQTLEGDARRRRRREVHRRVRARYRPTQLDDRGQFFGGELRERIRRLQRLRLLDQTLKAAKLRRHPQPHPDGARGDSRSSDALAERATAHRRIRHRGQRRGTARRCPRSRRSAPSPRGGRRR